MKRQTNNIGLSYTLVIILILHRINVTSLIRTNSVIEGLILKRNSTFNIMIACALENTRNQSTFLRMQVRFQTFLVLGIWIRLRFYENPR